MEKAVNSALQFDLVLSIIEPVGDSGRNYKHHLPVWKAGQEADLGKEYQCLEALMKVLELSKKTNEQFRSALTDIPWLPQTLKALQERALFLHECFELKKLLFHANQLKQLCQKHHLAKFYPFPDLEKPNALLDPEHTNSPSFALNAAFAPKLALYISQIQDLQLHKRQVEAELMQAAQHTLHLSQLTDVIVISRSQTAKINKLQNSAYYQLTDENALNLTFLLKDTKQLAEIKNQISALSLKLAVTEESVLNNLSKKLRAHVTTLTQTAELICMLDWDYAKANFAVQYNCIIPKLSNKPAINLTRAVNLPLQQNLALVCRTYQPIDLKFNTSLNVMTGPNMGGKTTALKTAGQLCQMVRYAIPIPAKEAELCLFDNIWYNHDGVPMDNLSSFGKEIVSLCSALKKKGRNLLLMDELAKGTNPVEGEAILIAVLEYVSNSNNLTLAATHFDQPALLKPAAHYAIKGIDTRTLAKLFKTIDSNLNTQLDLLSSLMDYSLIKLNGKNKPPQNAIPIAQVLGLPEEIINAALKIIQP